jgi:hypothetical protein
MSYMPADLMRLIDNIQAQVSGAPLEMIQLEYWNVVDEFFQKSSCWLDTIPVDCEPNVFTYPIAPDSPGEIHRLMWMTTNYSDPTKQDPRTLYQVAASMPDLGTLQLVFAPQAPTTYLVTLALTISQASNEASWPTVPDWFLGKYGQMGIKHGVLGALMMQTNKPWSNATSAAYHGKRFRGAISRAYEEMRRQNTFATQAWNYPQGWSVRKNRWYTNMGPGI